MRTHRIIEKSDLNGNIKFFPQKRIFFFWFPYFKTDVFPVEICFDSLESANIFVARQLKQPKPKVHYLKDIF
jgi:hypothetical protein